MTKIILANEIADWLGISRRTLKDPKYRARIGLKGIRIGRKLVFTEEDLENFLRSRREKFNL